MKVVDATAKTTPLQSVMWGRCFKHKDAILMRIRHTKGSNCGCVDLDSGDVSYLGVNTQVIVVEATVTVRNKDETA